MQQLAVHTKYKGNEKEQHWIRARTKQRHVFCVCQKKKKKKKKKSFAFTSLFLGGFALFFVCFRAEYYFRRSDGLSVREVSTPQPCNAVVVAVIQAALAAVVVAVIQAVVAAVVVAVIQAVVAAVVVAVIQAAVAAAVWLLFRLLSINWD